MSHANALAGEMRRLLASLRSAAPPLDRETADRLLTGRLDAADAPPGYGAVARLLAAATAPPGSDELAGGDAVAAEFMAVARSHSPTPTSRRAAMPGKRFSVRAITVAVAAVLTIGGVAAAATDLLPGSTGRVADQVPSATTHAPATDARGGGEGGASGGTASSVHGQRQGATGPDASGAARDGLCRAWRAGKGDDNGKREDSPAFQALAAAAGGADKVAAYCKAATSPQTGQGRQPEPPGTGGSPPSTAASPPGGGNGQGRGGPPTTGG